MGFEIEHAEQVAQGDERYPESSGQPSQGLAQPIGDSHAGEGEDGADIEEIEKKIKAAKMPKEALKKAEGELKKLKLMSPMSAEATVVRNYIDVLVGLPWAKKTKIKHNLGHAEGVLNEDHFGLEKVKDRDPAMFTKSGIMVGLGETREEVMQVMDDMRVAGVDFITIGQYLQPTRKHAAIDRYVTPDEFRFYETIARAKGFLMVAASPLTRSSHHAGEDFARLRAARSARG